MKIDQEKLKEQEKIISIFKDKGAAGTVVAATGFGKTYIAILLIQAMNKKQPGFKTLVVVPTIYLKEQWESKVKNFNLKDVIIKVINTAMKEEEEVAFLILDEIHRYAATKFVQVFDKVKYAYILGLTATLKREDERHNLLLEKAPVIYNIPLQTALKRGYISKFHVYNLGIIMPPYEQELYDRINDKYSKAFAFFDQDMDTAFECLDNEEIRRQVAEHWELTSKEIKLKAINYARLLQKRKQMLYKAQSKLLVVKRIIDKFGVKTVTFSESTEFADKLTELLGHDRSFSYHTKVKGGKKKMNEKLARFDDLSDPIHVINTAKAMDEGADIDGVELGVISSGTSAKRQNIQRIGRIVRFQEGKIALIVNIYFKNTQDEYWVRKRTKGTPNVHWIKNVDDIEYIPAQETTGKFALI